MICLTTIETVGFASPLSNIYEPVGLRGYVTRMYMEEKVNLGRYQQPSIPLMPQLNYQSNFSLEDFHKY